VTDSQDAQPTEALSRRALRESESKRSSSRRTTPANAASAGTAGAAGTTGAGGSENVAAGSGASGATGIGALLRRHPTAWLAGALGVAFLIVGTGAVFAGIASGSRSSAAEPLPTASEIPPRPQPSSIPAPGRLRTCSITAAAADGRLNAFSGYIANATTGEMLFDRNGEAAQRTGSVLKTLTAAAALNVLGPNAQLSTRVIDGSSPGTIVLQGGGDPTLATNPGTVYKGAPQIADLATAAMKAYKKLYPGVEIKNIILDSTMWDPADNWDSSWLRKEQSDGYQAEVTALMVDGGRADPTATVSSRSDDPVGDAGRAFADAAGLTGVTFSSGAAVGTTVLAEVKSQPLSTLIDQMMSWSDNILAENLARVISKSLGFNGSSTSLAQAIPGGLSEYGLNTTKIVIRDGSGLSDLNAVSPQFVTELMAKVKAGTKDLGVLYSALPVAGQSGSLAGRFTGQNAVAAGHIRAKTGWLDSAYSLAGIIDSADGTPLVFAFYSIRDGISSDAKDAQDSLATDAFNCGNNLSNN
jgi:D-alanyl-D-alanine carboxypeptidase/D-alanyl-D-alanine-endopeptidase (penicillin-binding protein 4)